MKFVVLTGFNISLSLAEGGGIWLPVCLVIRLFVHVLGSISSQWTTHVQYFL